MVAVFDIDGTLMDTNYQHALSWYRALRAKDIIVPIWRIHRAIGMGSDRVVSALAGEQAESDLGDELRDAEGSGYQKLIDEVEPMKAPTSYSASSSRGGTRGFAEQELTEAGASIVFDSVEHLRSHLGDTTLSETVS